MEISHKLIIAPTSCGKTFLCNYLLENGYLSSNDPQFDSRERVEYILITDLANEIKSGKISCEYKNIPLKNITDNLNNKTMNKIKKFSNKKNFIIIIDDLNKMIDSRSASNKEELMNIKQTKSNIDFIFSEGRHLNIYAVALVQHYKLLSPLIRNNSKYHIIVFGSTVTVEVLYDHVSHYFPDKQELKKFILEENVNHTSICFNTHGSSRNKEDNLILISPSSNSVQS